MKTIQNAEATVSTRESSGFVRTAILMKKGSTTSLDIVAEDGTLLCRINVSKFEAGNRGNVDIILDPAKQSASMTAYANGKRIIHGIVEGSAVHSVAINKRA